MHPPTFSRITLVAVTGLADAHGAALALAHSKAQLPGARALLCSPAAPTQLAPGIEHRVIAPLSYHEYSWFMLFALWQLVETDFALIVQEDGWVLDAAQWSDTFFDYDYLGAPVHLARVDSPTGTRWLRGFEWCGQWGQPGRHVMPVLNGGFSLRSRRMLRALIDHPQIQLQIPPPDALEGAPLRMRWFNDALNEDVQLSAILRPALEAVGLRFPPLELALRFGIEYAGPIHRGRDAMQLFGQHGPHRRLHRLAPLTVRYPITRAAVEAIFGETDIVAMLERRGYRIDYASEADSESGIDARPESAATTRARRIYDCFTYNGEADVLSIRLHELSPVVDCFVIVEADRSHRGDPKPLRFDAADPRLAPFLPRIRYIALRDLPMDTADGANAPAPPGDWFTDTPVSGYWRREKFQRNQIMRGLHDAAPDDLVMISDVDEIPSVAAVQTMRADRTQQRFGLRQAFFYFYGNYRNVAGPEADTVWSVAATRAQLDHYLPDRLRIGIRLGQIPAAILAEAGWHLSYLGLDEAGVRAKIGACAHQEYNNADYLAALDISALIASGRDLFGRQDFIWRVLAREEAPRWMASQPMFDHLFLPPDP